MEQVDRYTINKGAMNEYEVRDNGKGVTLLNTLGLTDNNEDKEIAYKICEYLIQLLADSNRPVCEINKVSYIAGTCKTVAYDKDDNRLILNQDDEIVSVNGHKPSSKEAEYYDKTFKLKVANEDKGFFKRLLQ